MNPTKYIYYRIPERYYMNSEITIVPAQPQDCYQIGKIKVKTWKSTYKGLLPDKTLQNLSVTRISASWKKKILSSLKKNPRNKILVAKTNGGQIIGYIHGGTQYNSGVENAGEIYVFYILKEFQNRGVGTQMFGEMRDYLSSLGYHTFFLWTLKGNPAMKFFKKMGGTPKLSKKEEAHGITVEEIGVVWE